MSSQKEAETLGEGVEGLSCGLLCGNHRGKREFTSVIYLRVEAGEWSDSQTGSEAEAEAGR